MLAFELLESLQCILNLIIQFEIITRFKTQILNLNLEFIGVRYLQRAGGEKSCCVRTGLCVRDRALLMMRPAFSEDTSQRIKILTKFKVILEIKKLQSNLSYRWYGKIYTQVYPKIKIPGKWSAQISKSGEIICLCNTVIYPVLPLHENNEKRGVRSDRTLKMVLMEKSLPYVDL